MEEIKNMLIEMQQEMKQQKADMHNMQEDIKDTINKNINEKFINLETKYSLLEQKLETQTIKISNLEKNLCQRKLVIFGVTENEKSYWDLEEKILAIINNNLNIRCDSSNIESARRLGKKGEKVRPIIITLTTMGLKIKIQKNKKKLESTSYYIKEYFPPEILNKRKELQVQVNKEREQGRLAIIKYDRIVILKDRNRKNSYEKKKRVLSESPKTAKSESENGKEKPMKIKKTNYMDNYVLRQQTLQLPSRKTTAQPQQPSATTTTPK
ncbi:unnamed protein product [Euphydryas editha]|uniref:Endonuclease-reverse transcriptase n=1 Tax=Euphydryas editha TaxID=104508 RepID=A0AAU9TXL6_EUPED|nr:unnamed protein product [Euphydryas editha]